MQGPAGEPRTPDATDTVLPERTARLVARAGDPVPAGGTPVVTIAATGVGGDVDLGLEPGSLSGSPEVAARLGEALLTRGIEILLAPSPSAGDPDEVACAAAAAGALLGPHRVGEVVFEGAEGPVSSYDEARRVLLRASLSRGPGGTLPSATAVISTWNKKDDVLANLAGLHAQARPFDEVVVVDNASSDGTAEAIHAAYPEVRVIVMPHSDYGACETFNIGFASALTELTAILDDDVVLPPNWLEGAMDRLMAEPESTAIVSTKIVEPGMPESYLESDEINTERYMSTFRGCASLARSDALRAAGGYDERLFIYGNERDLTCRLLNLGHRVLQYPGVEAFHKTPFGIKMGKRSLFFHARNAWLAQLKYAPLPDLLRLPWLVLTRVLLRDRRREEAGEISDATGTIGIGRSIRETPGSLWILVKAGASVIYNVPYCLRRREPCRAQDFELPIE